MTKFFPDFRQFAINVTSTFGNRATLLPSAETIASFGPDQSIDRVEEIFKMLNEVELDDSLKLTLLLPQELQLYWQIDEAMGEIFLSSTSRMCNRTVDPSQHELIFFDTPLADYRIFDEVANVGGPFFTLVKQVDNRMCEKLYFFDTRDCWEIALGIPEYLDIAMTSFAPLYWQCLFTDQVLSASRATHLSKSLAWLRENAPSSQVEFLHARLNEKAK